MNAKLLKYKVRLKIPAWLWQFANSVTLKHLVDTVRYQEKKSLRARINISEPRYFIIRRRPPGAGLFSNVFFVIQGIHRARVLGLTPIVDFKNYFMAEMQGFDNNAHSINSWELFFKPLADIDLRKIYKSGSYVLSSATKVGWGGGKDSDPFLLSKFPFWLQAPEKFKLVATLIEQNINLSNPAEDALEKVKNELCWNPRATLGVSLRGGNYVKYEYKGHARQQKPKEVFKEVSNLLRKHPIERILPLTQDFMFYESLVHQFGEMVIKPPVFRDYETSEEFLHLGPKPHPNHWDTGSTFLSFDQNLNYLLNVYLVSESRYFIGSLNNAVAFALAKNNSRYSNAQLFDLGTY